MGTSKSKFKCDTECKKNKDVNNYKYYDNHKDVNNKNKALERITRYDKYITRENNEKINTSITNYIGKKSPCNAKQQSDKHEPSYVSFSDIATSGNDSTNKIIKLRDSTQKNYGSMS